MQRDAILALLQPAYEAIEVQGIKLKVKHLTVREREVWRAASTKDDGSLKADWLLQLLALAVHDEACQPVWPDLASVDGPDGIISDMAKEVLRINGLAADSQKEAQGN